MPESQPFTILNVEPLSAPELMSARELRSAGFRVVEATTQEQALRLAASHPDIILLPMGFREIDAFGICHRIKTEPATAMIPVLWVVPANAGDWRELGIDCGDAYLRAPFQPNELLHTIQSLLLNTRKMQQKAAAAKAKKRTLLCIDDSSTGLEVRRGMLEVSGYAVLTADTGVSGLDVFSKHDVDAVILDYDMPEMNGERVAIELRRMNSRVPILLFSAYADAIPKTLLAAIDAFVAKGQHPMVLLDVLDQLLAPTVKKGPENVSEGGSRSSAEQ